jgi:NAD(P)-dependent dehydrogenase (short-subunit alcohol dehydrogenase family)
VRNIAVTGSASGIGAAVSERLSGAGDRVIGVDLRDAEVVADLSTDKGRSDAAREIESACGGTLDAFVPCAGIGGVVHPGSLVVSVNYFGAVALLDAVRPLLARAERPAAVAISSNSTVLVPGVPDALVDACLAGDEPAARALADDHTFFAYAGSKVALSRWIRRNAVSDAWAGAGVTLNAVAPGRITTALDAEQLQHETLGPLVESLPIPVGRPGRPEEIAAFVAFLLGPDARFFCGSILFHDGGTDALTRADDWPVGPRTNPDA